MSNGQKFNRVIYKILRLWYVAVNYYFFPFMAIILNFQYMVSYVDKVELNDMIWSKT